MHVTVNDENDLPWINNSTKYFQIQNLMKTIWPRFDQNHMKTTWPQFDHFSYIEVTKKVLVTSDHLGTLKLQKKVLTEKHSNMVRNRFLLLKWQKPSGMITSLMLLLDLLVYIDAKCPRYGPYHMAKYEIHSSLSWFWKLVKISRVSPWSSPTRQYFQSNSPQIVE